MQADVPTDAATHQAALIPGQRETEAGLGESGRSVAENRSVFWLEDPWSKQMGRSPGPKGNEDSAEYSFCFPQKHNSFWNPSKRFLGSLPKCVSQAAHH